jgi:hypothetical protein
MVNKRQKVVQIVKVGASDDFLALTGGAGANPDANKRPQIFKKTATNQNSG